MAEVGEGAAAPVKREKTSKKAIKQKREKKDGKEKKERRKKKQSTAADIAAEEKEATEAATPLAMPGEDAEEDGDTGQAGRGSEGEGEAPRKRVRKRKRKDKETPTETAAPETSPSAKGLTGSSRGAVVAGTVYVEGISYDANEADLEVFFSQVGKPSEVRMPRWHDSGKPRGYAHVEFADVAVASQAIQELNGQRMMGRSVTRIAAIHRC